MNASSSYRVWPQRAARVFQLGLSPVWSWLLLELKEAARLSPFKPTQQWNETNVYLTLAVPLSFIWHTQGNYTRCTYPFPLWSLFMCRLEENIFESFCLVRKETMHRIQELYLFIRLHEGWKCFKMCEQKLKTFRAKTKDLQLLISYGKASSWAVNLKPGSDYTQPLHHLLLVQEWSPLLCPTVFGHNGQTRGRCSEYTYLKNWSQLSSWRGWVELSVRSDVWQKVSSKSQREGAQDDGETCYDVCFGDGGTNKKQLEVTQLKIFVFGSDRKEQDW